MMSSPIRALICGLAVLFAAVPAQGQDRRAIWTYYQSPAGDGAGTMATLSYGVPETDAIAMDAICRSGKPGPFIDVMLLVDFGSYADGEPLSARFRSGTFDATYAGKVSIPGSEYAGVALKIGVDDPLWAVLAENHRISFGVRGFATTTVSLRRSAGPVRNFIRACQAQFADYDAGALPAAADLVASEYLCEDGSRFTARFDNSRSASIAVVTLANGAQIQLIEAVSGSGARYSNGDYELQTKADTAFFSGRGFALSCQSR